MDMKVVNTVVVFDRSALTETEPWARMHETIAEAVERIVHPAGGDRFLVRQKVNAPGRPRKQRIGAGLAGIRTGFLAGLTEAIQERGGSGDLESGLGRLARESEGLLMV